MVKDLESIVDKLKLESNYTSCVIIVMLPNISVSCFYL